MINSFDYNKNKGTTEVALKKMEQVMKKKKVLIVGAGMSGLVTAIRLAERGHKVTIFETNDKIGKKISITGNGRCNLSNQQIGRQNYHSLTDNIFQVVYDQAGEQATKQFFESIGISLIELGDKIFPKSLQAKSVVENLLARCQSLKINIVYQARIQTVYYTDKYRISVAGQHYYGEFLVLATGGRSYKDLGTRGDGYLLAQQFGHQITDTYPSIVQLCSDNPHCKALQGLKLMANASLWQEMNEVDFAFDNRSNRSKGVKQPKTQERKCLRQEFGEVLFTDYGLSGPPILQLSTEVEPGLSQGQKLTVDLDLEPALSEQELDRQLRKRCQQFSNRTIEQGLVGYYHHRLIRPLLKQAQIPAEQKMTDCSKNERNNLVAVIKKFQFSITKLYHWNQAQVTKGGVDCRQVTGQLESKLQPGLFFVGEVLDMDGDCGGYNIQWAVSSGLVVGNAIE